MDKTAEDCNFDNWCLEEENKRLYHLGKKYCEGWQGIQRENIGLLLWGPPGTGKTFATYNTYGREGETEILKILQNASLLVLDDLGAENNTDWSSEKLYEIIDSRYRAGKPMVVTTNLSLENLREKLASRDGITRSYDRLMEMCIPIEVKGTSRRARAGRFKTKILKELLEGEKI